MKYTFKGTIDKYNDNGEFITSYSYYINDKIIDIDELENILTLLENPKTSIDKEHIKNFIDKL